jgi:tetratricopeptide (TPR) repeat protein
MVDRGQWLEASRDIEMLKTQTAAPLPPRIQLANLAVLDGLQQTSEFKQALRATAAQNWDAEYAGERDLWRAYGYLLDGNVEVDPADLIQNALESGTLNKGDAYFARGLLAESLDESVQLYRQALKFSSFHLRARLQLVITLVLMGRRDEAAYEAAVAIDFFPDDLRFYHASALNAALGANRPATLKAIELSKSKFPKVDTSYILSALRLAGEFDRVLSTIEEVSPLSWLNLAVQLRTISLSGLNSIPVQEFHKPQVFEAFQHYMSCLTRPTFLIANAGKKFDLLMQASRESYEIHPDAFFLQCEGMVLLTIGRFAEAETVFCKAMEGFSLFPAVSREARFFAYASRAGVFGNSKRREDLEKAVEYLDDYPMSKITPARFVLAFEGLARAGRWDKVRELCEGLTCENDQRRSMMMTVARRAEEYENDGFAVTTWEDLLAEFPGDPELIEARTGLIKKLATQVEKSSDPADK